MSQKVNLKRFSGKVSAQLPPLTAQVKLSLLGYPLSLSASSCAADDQHATYAVPAAVRCHFHRWFARFMHNSAAHSKWLFFMGLFISTDHLFHFSRFWLFSFIILAYIICTYLRIHTYTHVCNNCAYFCLFGFIAFLQIFFWMFWLHIHSYPLFIFISIFLVASTYTFKPI